MLKEDKKVLMGLVVGAIIGLFIIGLTFAIIYWNDNSYAPDKVYFNETMTYEGIELTVSKMATVEEIEANSDLKRVLLLFTLKNTRTESFNFQYSDFELRTEDKGEKYNYVTFGTTFGDAIKDVLTNDIIGETIKAGETKNFYIMFDTPYRAHEKKFVLCIDWDYSTDEEQYFLYNRDGSLIPNCDTDESNKIESQVTDKTTDNTFVGECPVSVSVDYYTSSQNIRITAHNQTEKSIRAVKYLIVVYDVYGEVLKKYGYGSSAVSATYDDREISPKSVQTSDSSGTGGWNLSGFGNGKSVDIYVYSVYFSDGSEWGNKDMAAEDIKDQAPKFHGFGR